MTPFVVVVVDVDIWACVMKKFPTTGTARRAAPVAVSYGTFRNLANTTDYEPSTQDM